VASLQKGLVYQQEVVRQGGSFELRWVEGLEQNQFYLTWPRP